MYVCVCAVSRREAVRSLSHSLLPMGLLVILKYDNICVAYIHIYIHTYIPGLAVMCAGLCALLSVRDVTTQVRLGQVVDHFGKIPLRCFSFYILFYVCMYCM